MPHAFTNVGFETAGATPGFASGWTCAIVATAEEYASYDVAVPEPVEDFEEEWAGNEDSGFVLTDTATASYDVAVPEPFEDFEEDWANTPYSTTLPIVAVASYDSTAEDYEDFEESWKNNQDDINVFAGADITEAAYDLVAPEPREDFEEEWRHCEDDVTAFAGVGTDLVTATFDGQDYEDFEEVDLRMCTVEVTAVGADADQYIIYVNGSPVSRTCTGVGTLNSERDFLINSVNAAVLGASATADGTGKIKFRSTVSGDPLSIKVESKGVLAKIVLLAPPDKTSYWTQTGELA
jgi:hypothetical protein